MIVLLISFALIGAPAAWASTPQMEPPSALPLILVDRLSSGIKVVQIPQVPSEGTGLADIAFGYAVDPELESDRSAPGAVVREYLAVSVLARAAALAAHLAGGEFEIVDEDSLVGMRLRVPPASAASVLDPVTGYFALNVLDEDILEYARDRARERAAGETASGAGGPRRQDIRAALVGEEAAGVPDPDAIGTVSLHEIRQYFGDHFGTDRAYVISSGPIPPAAIEALDAVEARDSKFVSRAAPALPSDEVRLDFPSQPEGGVVLETAVASIHFEAWFGALIVDRYLRQILPPDARFEFQPSTRPGVHRIEIPVELPLVADEVRESVLDEIRQLQRRMPEPGRLEAAKREALRFVASRPMLEWFAAYGLWDALESGWTAIRNLDADGFRAAALRFDSNRQVAAAWAAAFQQPQVMVQGLDEAVPIPEQVAPPPVRPAPGRVPARLAGEADWPMPDPVQVERHASGVTLAESPNHAVFIAGPFHQELPGGLPNRGSNGTLWSFPEAPGPEALERLSAVRPDRLLFFYPASEMAAARRRFEDWVSGTFDSTPTLPEGSVSTLDLPALVVLKTWLDAKLIEAGWWSDADLRIEGIEGSRLVIDTDPERESVIRSWIGDVAAERLEEGEFVQVRNATMGYFERLRRELQILLWQRDPMGTIFLPSTVSLGHLRDVADIYF